ncbi:MAG: hypothetical protein HN370_09020, partial [Phycisphaerales bacterium]|nr:hypothetical protein [Phycisphaerales bacterium]
MKRSSRTYFVLAVLMSLASLTMAGTIGYLEDFSLAKDRDAALKQLIPGTQDYYYFHCLHYLNTGQSEKVPPLQKLWSKRYGETSQFREIRHRQVLLSYKSDPKAALAYLKLNLGLSFNHQREELNKKLTLPTTLDQSKISFATLAKRAYRDSYHSVSGFTRASYPWLATQPLRETRRRDLLRRLVRPDLPGLVKLIAADLDYKDSRGFGSMSIHAKLTRAQLDELVKLKPELKLNSNFIYASLRQLAPNPDEDRRYNKAVIKAHLDRLWNYVSTLPSSWNSLKANVLYHRLVFDRSQGLYDRERFLRYIQLPRRDGLCNVELYKKISRTNSSSFVNLNSNYSSYCGLGSIRNDNALVRDYLMNLFRDETTWKQEKYTNYLRDTYLKPIFAETKILAGMGDMEQWYSWLSPSAYKALKARVDLDFAPWNPEVYGPDDKVKLELYVKNAKTLLVKVFEINELNYYRATGQQINTQIDLDGLVANYQKTYTYTDPALRRVKRTFELPQCKGRGIFVVEFIGNGKSSRAIIRKGKLNFLSRTSSAGQVFTVLDEQGDVVNDASIHLRGREYETDEDAQILIPYSTNPRNEQIIIQSGNFATLASFQHLGESYQLNAGIHVERGTLLKGETANVTLRPALRMHNRDVSLDLLEEVHLTIYSTDLYGITSTRKIKDIKLHHDKDTLCEFKVPNNLQ